MFRFVLFYAAFACGSLSAQTNAPLTADQIMQQVGAPTIKHLVPAMVRRA